jgi:hypothetical protein
MTAAALAGAGCAGWSRRQQTQRAALSSCTDAFKMQPHWRYVPRWHGLDIRCTSGVGCCTPPASSCAKHNGVCAHGTRWLMLFAPGVSSASGQALPACSGAQEAAGAVG